MNLAFADGRVSIARTPISPRVKVKSTNKKGLLSESLCQGPGHLALINYTMHNNATGRSRRSLSPCGRDRPLCGAAARTAGPYECHREERLPTPTAPWTAARRKRSPGAGPGAVGTMNGDPVADVTAPTMPIDLAYDQTPPGASLNEDLYHNPASGEAPTGIEERRRIRTEWVISVTPSGGAGHPPVSPAIRGSTTGQQYAKLRARFHHRSL